MKKRKVLLVPLNWGLGHATRLIPVIRRFMAEGAFVLVGGSPSQLIILREEFPEIKTIIVPFAKVRFNGTQNQLLSFACQVPFFLYQILREHFALKNIIKQYNIDLIVSDNCYGLWNKKIHSVFITHQINIILPHRLKSFTKLINKINHWFIQQYDECWIPDLENNGGYAGKLSHGISLKNKIRYIGIQSRFSTMLTANKAQTPGHRKNLVLLISGPENQRTAFEQMIKDQIKYIPDEFEYTVIRGLPEKKSSQLPGWYNHLPSKQFIDIIIKADAIVCRSGYSTIMDLIAMKKTALLVPTPGQPEQEYLAEYLSSKKFFCAMNQNEFDIRKGLEILMASSRKTYSIS